MTPVAPMTSEGTIYGPRWREGPNRPMQRRAKWFRAPIKIEQKENNLTCLETRKSIVSDFIVLPSQEPKSWWKTEIPYFTRGISVRPQKA
ncbi:LOW QUALITY PROTEIN: hypothetical protein PanWU01x14_214590 [Parasponia andersonii]|uniref:Uncharacterized protein n=1 Tax=Parasponia andersonii TaxID=3476 RepID=A0A2P5BS60_PARAD|nr:LOW QUALITY PROTEIN: hypothetical protein PanWU01x14_214590 [Parasponia andersonii]